MNMSEIHKDIFIEFCRRQDIKEAMQADNYSLIYNAISRVDPSQVSGLVSEATEIFLEAGINPLLYLSTIPEFFLAGSEKADQVRIPEHIVRVGRRAFPESNIGDLVLPEGVVSIESAAFARCKALKSVVLPSTLAIVGISAFRKCPNLASIEYAGTKQKFRDLLDSDLVFSTKCETIASCQDGKLKYQPDTGRWIDVN